MPDSNSQVAKRVEHTPGPWVVAIPRSDEPSVWIYSHEDSTPRTTIVDSAALDVFPLSDADARLISAAPDLLEALELAVATIDRLGVQRGPFKSGQGTLDVARAAIAKARGQ